MDTRAIYEQCVKEEEELQFVAFTQTDALQLGNLFSLRFWTDVQLSGSTAEEKRMPETEYACCGGGFPLTIKGVGVIGTICVSGLPHTDDHKVIIEALTDYLK